MLMLTMGLRKPEWWHHGCPEWNDLLEKAQCELDVARRTETTDNMCFEIFLFSSISVSILEGQLEAMLGGDLRLR